jgi:uncharacterized protein (TIGR02145 family)
MAENLNYDESDSVCYRNDEANCAKYGRLYNWETALMVCPSGWHLPSASDWDTLMNFVQTDNGGTYANGNHASIAGKYLKATNGWNNNGNGEDKYGFEALPGGNGTYVAGNFFNVGNRSHWWSSSENDSTKAYYRAIYYNAENVYWYNIDKGYLFSVRCLQD